MCIQIVACSGVPEDSHTNVIDQPTSPGCGFGCYINPLYDDGVVPATILVSEEFVASLETNHDYPLYLPLTLNPDGSTSAILHLNFPAAESLLSGYAHPYGRLFGIPQEITDGWYKSRVISPPELLLWHSIPKKTLRDEISWLSKGAIMVYLFPGALY